MGSLILACLLGGGAWRKRVHLRGLEEEHRKLVENAARLGLKIGGRDRDLIRSITKHQRGKDEAKVRQVADKWLAMPAEVYVSKDDSERRTLEFYEMLESLSARQLVLLFRDLQKNPQSKELLGEYENQILYYLADKDPGSALKLCEEFLHSPDKKMIGGYEGGLALRKLAELDPAAAYAWVQAQQPGRNKERFESAVLEGAMQKSPLVAFQLFQTMSAEQQENLSSSLLSMCKTPEARLETLNRLRESVGKIADPQKANQRLEAVMDSLGSVMADQADGIGWIDSLQLTESEKRAFAANLGFHETRGKTKEWLDWMDENLPSGVSQKPIRNLVEEWTQKDFQAVALWLNEKPAGPAKEVAVRSFSATVAGYDPQGAVNWAQTLPEGKGKAEVYRVIYMRWPYEDPQGKAAFGAEHGLK
ncbi:MAG: hypothetical protein QM680_03290 [Luteolibacter sp.]